MEEIKSGISAGWIKLRNVVSDIEVDYESHDEILQPKKKTSARKYSCAVRTSKSLLKRKSQRADLAPKYSIAIRNPKYSATIANEIGNLFMLNELDFVSCKDFLVTGSREVAYDVAPVVACFAIKGYLISDFVEQSQFVSGEERVDTGMRMVHTTWRYRPLAENTRYEMEVVFSPDEDWAIRSTSGVYQTYTEHRLICVQPYSGSFIPKSIVEESRFINESEPVERRTITFDSPKETAVDANECYLSFYGLPEPSNDYRPLVYGLVILIVGLGLCCAAVYRWYSGAWQSMNLTQRQ